MDKRIAIGCDHGGFKLKEVLKSYLIKKGYVIKDFGTHPENPSDYPVVGYKLAEDISKGKIKRGILICKSGIGMAIMANKLPRVRSAVCDNIKQTKTSRLHNDTNVLSLGSEYINESKAKKIVNTWLNTPSLGGRHKRRVDQIKRFEKKKV